MRVAPGKLPAGARKSGAPDHQSQRALLVLSRGKGKLSFARKPERESLITPSQGPPKRPPAGDAEGPSRRGGTRSGRRRRPRGCSAPCNWRRPCPRVAPAEEPGEGGALYCALAEGRTGKRPQAGGCWRRPQLGPRPDTTPARGGTLRPPSRGGPCRPRVTAGDLRGSAGGGGAAAPPPAAPLPSLSPHFLSPGPPPLLRRRSAERAPPRARGRGRGRRGGAAAVAGRPAGLRPSRAGPAPRPGAHHAAAAAPGAPGALLPLLQGSAGRRPPARPPSGPGRGGARGLQPARGAGAEVPERGDVWARGGRGDDRGPGARAAPMGRRRADAAGRRPSPRGPGVTPGCSPCL